MSGLSFRSSVASTSGLRASFSAPAVAARAPLVVENRVSIRFTRFGRRNKPSYRIVAIDARKRREGRPLEWLGHYDPFSKEVSLDAPNIQKWLDCGAVPTQPVKKLLKKALVIE
jgi:small subunit ribosomal protein S16